MAIKVALVFSHDVQGAPRMKDGWIGILAEGSVS